MEQIVVCIPAFNPTRSLILLLEQLTEYPFRRIVIVNDGSDLKSKDIFKKAATFENVDIIHFKKIVEKAKQLKWRCNT